MNRIVALGIRDLKFRYPGSNRNGEWVVNLPALDLLPGEQMLLTGGSGRGKSTLLNIIAGLYDPQEGHVYISGKNIHSLHHAKRDHFRGQNIGMIFQTFNLLHGFSAVENVMAALMFSKVPRREHRKRALDLLHHLGIDNPNGNPDRMSVGQQQRVAVARAVVCKPALVLADEPTASLDPENARRAVQLIKGICHEQGAALLCVSHDPALVSRFDRRASLGALMAGQTEFEPQTPEPEEEMV